MSRVLKRIEVEVLSKGSHGVTVRAFPLFEQMVLYDPDKERVSNLGKFDAVLSPGVAAKLAKGTRFTALVDMNATTAVEFFALIEEPV